MTANLHAIWLDDLAPGEGATTPIWDALYAEQDAETQRVVFNACADEHTEPVAVPYLSPTCAGCGQPATGLASIGDKRYCHSGGDCEPTCYESATWALSKIDPAPELLTLVEAAAKPAPKRRKKPAKPSPLAAQEAKLRTVRGRLADEFKTLGGDEAGAVNELGVAFVCLLGLLLAPVIVAVFG